MNRSPDELTRTTDAFLAFGGTDVAYLSAHCARFLETKRIFEASWNRDRGRVLDVGAHWLHQSHFYARDGYQVTAADFPSTLGLESVRKAANAWGITLIWTEKRLRFLRPNVHVEMQLCSKERGIELNPAW